LKRFRLFMNRIEMDLLSPALSSRGGEESLLRRLVVHGPMGRFIEID